MKRGLPVTKLVSVVLWHSAILTLRVLGTGCICRCLFAKVLSEFRNVMWEQAAESVAGFHRRRAGGGVTL